MKVVILQLSEETHDYLSGLVERYSAAGMHPSEAADLAQLWAAINQTQVVDTDQLRQPPASTPPPSYGEDTRPHIPEDDRPANDGESSLKRGDV